MGEKDVTIRVYVTSQYTHPLTNHKQQRLSGGSGEFSSFSVCSSLSMCHDDVIKWKQFPRYWPFVRRIHRSPVKSPLKGQWRGTLLFCLICVWINGSVNNLDAGDLRRHRLWRHCNVMIWIPGLSVFGWTSTKLFCIPKQRHKCIIYVTLDFDIDVISSKLLDYCFWVIIT